MFMRTSVMRVCERASDSPDLGASLFQVLGVTVKVCNAKAYVLTGASMRGVPNRVFLTGGYMGVFFTFLLVWCFPEKWSMHVCANKHAHPTTASIDPCCGETHDISG